MPVITPEWISALGYSPTDGARFEVHLEKARGIFGDDAKPFEAKLDSVNGAMTWTMRDLENVEAQRAADLKSDGYILFQRRRC
jgi:putative DNA primase/helicase